MSRITSKVASTVSKAMTQYGDLIEVIDRNGAHYQLTAICRRPTFIVTLDATVSEYYFLVSANDFNRVRAAIGANISPAPFFGEETIVYNGETYLLRKSEPWEYYDGTRQVIRIWAVKKI